MIQHYPFEVLPLPYLYDSLEPNINMETMFFHHSKHLAAYVDTNGPWNGCFWKIRSFLRISAQKSGTMPEAFTTISSILPACPPTPPIS